MYIKLLTVVLAAIAGGFLAMSVVTASRNRLLSLRWTGKSAYARRFLQWNCVLLRPRGLHVEQQVSELALSIMAGISSGQSILQSLYQCSPYLSTPMREAVLRSLQMYETGVPFTKALSSVRPQLASRDFDQLTRVVMLFEKLGSDPRTALSCVAQGAQERSHARALLASKLSEVRVSAVIVSILPLLLGSVTALAQPDVVLFALGSPPGRAAYLLGIVLWLSGAYLVWRLSNPTWL